MEPSRRLLILNPGAGHAVREEVERVLGERMRIVLTEGRGRASELARRAVEEGVGTVVAGGGDGTLHEVVNGLLPDPGRTVCGQLPLGTGNDFARTLGLPSDIERWAELLEGGRTRTVDVIELDGSFGRRWAVNCVVGGAIDRVDEKLTEEVKRFWGPLSYLRATAETLPELEPFAVELLFDDGERIAREAHAVVVANGRTVAGGVPVAPEADPADGAMDCLLLAAVQGVDLVTLAGKVLLGAHLGDEHALFRRARSLRLTSRPAMAFHADGERLDAARATFTIRPAALRMLVGGGAE
jgi:diacylglycerol kinase (ATP)